MADCHPYLLRAGAHPSLYRRGLPRGLSLLSLFDGRQPFWRPSPTFTVLTSGESFDRDNRFAKQVMFTAQFRKHLSVIGHAPSWFLGKSCCTTKHGPSYLHDTIKKSTLRGLIRLSRWNYACFWKCPITVNTTPTQTITNMDKKNGFWVCR